MHDLHIQVSEEEARATIAHEMKKRELDYTFYETSALTGQNLKELAKKIGMFGTCHVHIYVDTTCGAWPCSGLYFINNIYCHDFDVKLAMACCIMHCNVLPDLHIVNI